MSGPFTDSHDVHDFSHAARVPTPEQELKKTSILGTDHSQFLECKYTKVVFILQAFLFNYDIRLRSDLPILMVNIYSIIISDLYLTSIRMHVHSKTTHMCTLIPFCTGLAQHHQQHKHFCKTTQNRQMAMNSYMIHFRFRTTYERDFNLILKDLCVHTFLRGSHLCRIEAKNLIFVTSRTSLWACGYHHYNHHNE